MEERNEGYSYQCVDCTIVIILKKKRGWKTEFRCRSCRGKFATASDEVRQKRREHALRQWSDPEIRERQIAATKEAQSDPEYRKRLSGIIKEVHTRPEFKEKHSMSTRRSHSDPTYRKMMSIKHGGDGDVQRIERSRVERPYHESRLWTETVKKRDGGKCRVCGSTSKLHAHHIKLRSKHPELALDLDNGITLCFSCHMDEHRKIRRKIREETDCPSTGPL